MAMKLIVVGILALVSPAAAVGVEDVSGLVQSSMRAHQQQAAVAQALSAVNNSRMQLLAQLAAKQLPDLQAIQSALHPKFDCDKYPGLCKEPFNCQSFSPLELAPSFLSGFAAGGKANLKMWCMAPQYAPYLETCLVQKDLVKAGEIQYQWTIDQHNGVEEMDGSYCFIEGHCTNTAVTTDTTLEESYKMCDDRYGHDGWTKFGSPATVVPILPRINAVGMSAKDGFHDTALTQAFLKAACAMGNYHCDVMYCKATYCQKPYYVQKYGHLLPKAPGHLIQEKDWLQ